MALKFNSCSRNGQKHQRSLIPICKCHSLEMLVVPVVALALSHHSPWLMSSLAGAGCTMASCPRTASTAQSSPQSPPGSIDKRLHSQPPALEMAPSWLWGCTLWSLGFRECCLSPIKQHWEVLDCFRGSVTPPGKWSGMMLSPPYTPLGGSGAVQMLSFP